MNGLPDFDDRYIKTKIRTDGDKVYSNFHNVNVPRDGVECESFDSLLVYDNKFYLQVYLDNCAYKIVDKQMTDYLGDNLFETNDDYFQCKNAFLNPMHLTENRQKLLDMDDCTIDSISSVDTTLILFGL